MGHQTRAPHPAPISTLPEVVRQVAELPHLSMAELTQRWQVVMGTDVPHANKRTLIQHLAYRLQELAYGGLAPETQAQLAEIYTQAGCPARMRGRDRQERPAAMPGTTLVREWRGATYQVTVCAQGYAYQGRLYRSLSAIAREITGTRCSGPAFFGVKERAR